MFYQDGFKTQSSSYTIIPQNLDTAEKIFTEVAHTEYPRAVHYLGVYLNYHKSYRSFDHER